ncbi:hypothetical protein NESM_000836500 [Novymonas esmeraldas]|uniref:200 kDa antigen p200 n=1 Tax=Novymonas esmeraldas TaxID=1808958 RepID=A0AAW0EZI3_9TRYP
MFLFRRGAEGMEDGHEHHEPINETANGHRDEDEIHDGAYREASGSAEPHDTTPERAAPHRPTDREGTVPPLEERDVVERHGGSDADEDADAAPAAPPAPAPSNGVPALSMPRTQNTNGTAAAAANGGVVERHGHNPHTPRGAAPSPRSASGVSRGRSFSISGLSAAEVAEAHEQQYRRCSSVVQSARSLSARRASSVNGIVGTFGGDGYSPAEHRGGGMSEGERAAVARMMENEYRRREAAERSSQFALVRESTLVEQGLARERAMYEHRMHLDEALHERLDKSSRSRQERALATAQRRQAQEEERTRALRGAVAEKDTRYHLRDPYAVMAAQRRYSTEMRSSIVIAPQRRASSPPAWANGHTSRRTSGGAGDGTVEDRRASSPAELRRNSSPRIDMSKPRQCLTLDAWKTPEQLRRASTQKNRGASPTRCLSPKAWRATTVADHPRQWH